MSDDEKQSAEEHIHLLAAQIDELRANSAESLRESMLQLERSMCDKFRILREERGWSQSDLSERLSEWGFDLHQTTIAKLEKGKRPLRVAEMYALSHVFQLPPGAVFFMAHSSRAFDGMDELTAEIERIETGMAEMRAMVSRQIDQTISIIGDYQTKRNQLVDLMRRVAAEQPTWNGAREWLEANSEGVGPQPKQSPDGWAMLQDLVDEMKGTNDGEHQEAP